MLRITMVSSICILLLGSIVLLQSCKRNATGMANGRVYLSFDVLMPGSVGPSHSSEVPIASDLSRRHCYAFTLSVFIANGARGVS